MSPSTKEFPDDLPSESGPTEDDFFYALAAGDLQQAAAVLRSLGGLGPEAAEILADLLEGNPKQEEWFQEHFPIALSFAAGDRENRQIGLNVGYGRQRLGTRSARN